MHGMRNEEAGAASYGRTGISRWRGSKGRKKVEENRRRHYGVRREGNAKPEMMTAASGMRSATEENLRHCCQPELVIPNRRQQTENRRNRRTDHLKKQKAWRTREEERRTKS